MPVFAIALIAAFAALASSTWAAEPSALTRGREQARNLLADTRTQAEALFVLEQAGIRAVMSDPQGLEPAERNEVLLDYARALNAVSPRRTEAVNVLERLIELDSKYAPAHRLLAETLAGLPRHQWTAENRARAKKAMETYIEEKFSYRIPFGMFTGPIDFDLEPTIASEPLPDDALELSVYEDGDRNICKFMERMTSDRQFFAIEYLLSPHSNTLDTTKTLITIMTDQDSEYGPGYFYDILGDRFNTIDINNDGIDDAAALDDYGKRHYLIGTHQYQPTFKVIGSREAAAAIPEKYVRFKNRNYILSGNWDGQKYTVDVALISDKGEVRTACPSSTKTVRFAQKVLCDDKRFCAALAAYNDNKPPLAYFNGPGAMKVIHRAAQKLVPDPEESSEIRRHLRTVDPFNNGTSTAFVIGDERRARSYRLYRLAGDELERVDWPWGNDYLNHNSLASMELVTMQGKTLQVLKKFTMSGLFRQNIELYFSFIEDGVQKNVGSIRLWNDIILEAPHSP